MFLLLRVENLLTTSEDVDLMDTVTPNITIDHETGGLTGMWRLPKASICRLRASSGPFCEGCRFTLSFPGPVV